MIFPDSHFCVQVCLPQNLQFSTQFRYLVPGFHGECGYVSQVCQIQIYGDKGYFVSPSTHIHRDTSSIVKAVESARSDHDSETALNLFEKSTAKIDALVCIIGFNQALVNICVPGRYLGDAIYSDLRLVDTHSLHSPFSDRDLKDFVTVWRIDSLH